MRIRQPRRRVRRTAQAHRRTPDQKQAGTCILARTLSRMARSRDDGPTFSGPTLAGATHLAILAMSGSGAYRVALSTALRAVSLPPNRGGG